MTEEAATPYLLLLQALDPDTKKAAQRLELLRHVSIVLLNRKGANIIDSEVLADKAIDILAENLQQGEAITNIPGFLRRVVNNLWLNHYRKLKVEQAKTTEYQYLVNISGPALPEQTQRIVEECGQECLDELEAEEKTLLLEYKAGNSHIRAALARQYGFTRNSLTIKISRIVTTLRLCREKCVKRRCLE